MRYWMDRILERYGQPGTVFSDGGSRTVQLIMQSVRSLSWQNMDHRHCPLGEIPRGQYICLMPADTEAVEGDDLMVEGTEYTLRRVERMKAGEETIYLWCLCVEKGA